MNKIRTPILLIVEDDPDMRIEMSDGLKLHGFETLSATSLKRALEYSNNVHVDMVVLDLELPDGNAVHSISDIKNGLLCPVIIFSGIKEFSTKIQCLENGACDYIEKPVHLGELAARINAHLMNVSNHHLKRRKDNELNFHHWVIDDAKCQLFNADGGSATLTMQEYIIFRTLYDQVGKPVSRYDLCNIIKRGTCFPTERSVDVAVTRLRKKLGDSKKSPQYIKTVRGIGYMVDRRE